MGWYYRFNNEPIPDFSKPEEKEKMEKAITEVRNSLGKKYPLIYGTSTEFSNDRFVSINPNKPEEILGSFVNASEGSVDFALRRAEDTLKDWKSKSLEERANYLTKLARILQKKKYDLSATMVLECGKNWTEAAADTAELIDFCNFYAKDAMRLSRIKPPNREAEDIGFRYDAIGVGSIIAPWNFPAAILGGMTLAAIVMGNTVLMKPASDAALTGWVFFNALREAGFPNGVVNYLTGSGSVLGKAMVEHPDIRFIAFTGSREVGEQIYKAVGTPGRKHLKVVPLLEMGGKNGIIIADDAELEAAAKATVASAFGFQGQKCSACSRVIVDKKVYEQFVEMLVKETQKLKVGPVENCENFMGAVINEAAMNKILRYIEIGKNEGKLLTGGKRAEGLEGYVIEPTIISDVSPDAVIAQEEIFGPVLAVIKADDFEDALTIMNNTNYGLTGAVFTTSKYRIDQAVKEIELGNLYINRKCTGALVYYHPFGGRNMSGINKKAGGFDTLVNFAAPKSIATAKGTYK